MTLRLRVATDVHAPVTGALVRRGDVQVTAMNHLGPSLPGHAMLLAVRLAGGDVSRARAVVEGLLASGPFDDIVEHHTIDPPGGVHHATSTCRIGVVADEDGRVDGFTNVHVVDASAFPDVPRANTYLPTLLLAERLAARLTGRA